MRKSTVLLGLATAILFSGSAYSDEEDKRIIIKDGFIEKVRIIDEADTDGDGKISREEYLADPGHDFEDLDTNNDGYLDREERKNSGLIMRKEFHWNAENHARLMEALDKKLANVDEKIAKALEKLEGLGFGWHGEFEFDGLDFDFEGSPEHHKRLFGFDFLGDRLMNRFDENEDGQVTREEFVNARDKFFERLDENGDGVLDEDELAHFGLNGIFAFERFHSEDED